MTVLSPVEDGPTTAARNAEKRQALVRTALRGPLVFALMVLVVGPLVILALYSFWQVYLLELVYDWSFANYRTIFQDDVYLRSLWNSLVIGVATATLTTILAFLLAWAIRFHVTRGRNLLVLIIVVSSVGSYLARIYAWRGILGSSGAINYFLTSVGIIDEPLTNLIFNRFATTVALTNLFLPYAFLPIYANLLTIEPEVLEAGRVLGAGPIRNFWRVGLPLSATGAMVSFTYVLVFATGDFATAIYLGGPQGLVTAALINNAFGVSYDWPLGAALSFVYMAALAVIVGILATITARRARRIGQR